MESVNKIVGEIWKDVVGYEGLYNVSNLGRIKSCTRVLKNGEFVLMKPRITKFGYLSIQLSKNNFYKHFFVHVLVSAAFDRPKKNKKEQINHIDGNKLNNNIFNLEIVSPSENLKHSYRIGLKSQKGEKHASNKLKNNQVLDIFNRNGTFFEIAKLYNISFQMVSRIKNGLAWSHLTGKIYIKK